jgi:hypothetical protein
MKKEDLPRIVEKYLNRGVLKGGEFLQPPEDVVQFIDDLVNAGILISGCDLWRYLDPTKDPTGIVALVGAGVLVSRSTNPKKGTVEGNAEIVKGFILHQLPEDAELVSLIFLDGEIYDFFLMKGIL